MILIIIQELDMVICTWNPNTEDAEQGNHPGLHGVGGETLLGKNTNKQ